MAGNLEKYGFAEFGSYADPEEGCYARIISQSQGLYRAVTDEATVLCEISGRLRYESLELEDYPAVGDFVVLDRMSDEHGNAIIHKILPRKSTFVRNAAGSLNRAQVVASNIDYVFICTSLNHDFNLKRLERYVSLAWNSGAVPVVVLTKADLCLDVESKLTAVEAAAPGVEVLLTSSVDEDGLEEIEQFLRKGKTIALLGSSGVGKSTIINKLLGMEVTDTNEIREADGRGRHTTTQRQMYLLENGCILIDTPGMRELGLTSETDDLSQSFEDVEYFLGRCRFSDCTHTSEPGCAIFEAIANGELSERRWNSYNRLRRENEFAQDKAGYLQKKDSMLTERRARKKEAARNKGKRR